MSPPSRLLQAIALCQYLETLGSGALSGRRVIELGAGTGLTGMVASALGNAAVVPLFIALHLVAAITVAALGSFLHFLKNLYHPKVLSTK